MFKQIHIVACSPRTGTTLLHEAMVTCFKVDKKYDHEIRFHLTDANDGDVLISKRPKDTYYMSQILDQTPDFYVIYLLRDPRDSICSRHGKDMSKYYSNLTLWRDLHAHGKALRNFNNFLEIRYEDFVSDPNAVQQQIMQRFPWLEKLHDFTDYHLHAKVSEGSSKALKGLRPISPASIGLWKKNLQRIKGQTLRHGSMTPDLIDCGYENDDSWESILDGVEPDFSKSRYPETISIFKRLSLKLHGFLKVREFKRKRGKRFSC
ncbi:sulfotransferase family protein [Catenovulum sp. SX2]|uniref:sulfotransferase family protein n=1 Tax=Catenovulum sp. SX2 TaxID=3398614 RepID=UPI003F8499AF